MTDPPPPAPGRLPHAPATQDGWCHVTATMTQLGDRWLLLLPFAAPVGRSRGRRYLVRFDPDGPARQRTVFNVGGRAALVPPPAQRKVAAEVPLRICAVPPQRQLRIPRDLGSALRADGLALDVVPEPERSQLIHMVNESSAPEVRQARLAMAQQVARQWSRRADKD